MNNTDIPTVLFGFPEEWENYRKRHPQWSEVSPRLENIINRAFTRKMDKGTVKDIDKFVYFYGNLVAEDFMEILLMAGNGYGFAAMKLLRSMYEHTVVLKYLHKHPEELQAFFDFATVQRGKLLQNIETFGKNALPQGNIDDNEQEYEAIKQKFMVKTCNDKNCTCTHMRVNYTWSKLDFVAMAKKTGVLGGMLVNAYRAPLLHVHPTLRTITERLERKDEHVGFSRELQPKEADEALMMAHCCLLVAIEVQKEQFNIPGLEDALTEANRDWASVWSQAEILPS